MYVEGPGDYPLDWYNATVAAFRKTNYLHIIEGDHSVIFIYSTFEIDKIYNKTLNVLFTIFRIKIIKFNIIIKFDNNFLLYYNLMKNLNNKFEDAL